MVSYTSCKYNIFNQEMAFVSVGLVGREKRKKNEKKKNVYGKEKRGSKHDQN